MTQLKKILTNYYLKKDESLVYACLSLRPKSMEELLKRQDLQCLRWQISCRD